MLLEHMAFSKGHDSVVGGITFKMNVLWHWQDSVLHRLQTGVQAGLSDCVQVLPWMVPA